MSMYTVDTKNRVSRCHGVPCELILYNSNCNFPIPRPLVTSCARPGLGIHTVLVWKGSSAQTESEKAAPRTEQEWEQEQEH